MKVLLSLFCLVVAEVTLAQGIFARRNVQSSGGSGSTAQAAAVSSGAITAQLSQQLKELQVTLQGVSAQLEALEQNHAALAERVQRMEQGTSGTASAEITALRRDLEALKASQGAMRTEIVADLSKKIAQINQMQKPPTPTPKPQPRGSGYEHVVEPGQTLSEIARGYGKSIKVIQEANGITDASKLQVGQKLFIPD